MCVLALDFIIVDVVALPVLLFVVSVLFLNIIVGGSCDGEYEYQR